MNIHDKAIYEQFISTLGLDGVDELQEKLKEIVGAIDSIQTNDYNSSYEAVENLTTARETVRVCKFIIQMAERGEFYPGSLYQLLVWVLIPALFDVDSDLKHVSKTASSEFVKSYVKPARKLVKKFLLHLAPGIAEEMGYQSARTMMKSAAAVKVHVHKVSTEGDVA